MSVQCSASRAPIVGASDTEYGEENVEQFTLSLH